MHVEQVHFMRILYLFFLFPCFLKGIFYFQINQALTATRIKPVFNWASQILRICFSYILQTLNSCTVHFVHGQICEHHCNDVPTELKINNQLNNQMQEPLHPSENVQIWNSFSSSTEASSNIFIKDAVEIGRSYRTLRPWNLDDPFLNMTVNTMTIQCPMPIT